MKKGDMLRRKTEEEGHPAYGLQFGQIRNRWKEEDV